jgi:hypothetical protein
MYSRTRLSAISSVDGSVHREYIEYPGKNEDNSPSDFSCFWPFVTDEDHQESHGMGDDIGKPVVRQIRRSSPSRGSLI